MSGSQTQTTSNYDQTLKELQERLARIKLGVAATTEDTTKRRKTSSLYVKSEEKYLEKSDDEDEDEDEDKDKNENDDFRSERRTSRRTSQRIQQRIHERIKQTMQQECEEGGQQDTDRVGSARKALLLEREQRHRTQQGTERVKNSTQEIVLNDNFHIPSPHPQRPQPVRYLPVRLRIPVKEQRKQHSKASMLSRPKFQHLESNAAIGILGKRRTGKTTFTQYILQYMNIEKIMILSGNRDNAIEWSQIVHPNYIFRVDVLKQLKRTIKYQSKIVAKYRKLRIPLPKEYLLHVVVDDLASRRTFMMHPIMQDLMCNGRHYGMTVIILLQYLNQLHPNNRDQFDYIGMLHTRNMKNIIKIHTEYGNLVNLKNFESLFRGSTLDKGIFWIDNTIPSDDITLCLFKDRVPVSLGDKVLRREQLKLLLQPVGSVRTIQYAQRHYLEEESDDDDDDDEDEEEKNNKNGTQEMKFSHLRNSEDSEEDSDVEIDEFTKFPSHPWLGKTSYLQHLQQYQQNHNIALPTAPSAPFAPFAPPPLLNNNIFQPPPHGRSQISQMYNPFSYVTAGGGDNREKMKFE